MSSPEKPGRISRVLLVDNGNLSYLKSTNTRLCHHGLAG